MRLLVAEDDAPLRGLMTRALRAEGFEVAEAADGHAALRAAAEVLPHLLLLDLEMPGQGGMDVLRALRGSGADFPILMLTACTELDTRIEALDSGADDFLTKPFALRELKARTKALLRRAHKGEHAAQTTVLSWGGLQLDRVRHTVAMGREVVALTGREFRLLEELLLARGRSLSRAELLERIWERSEAKANLVDVYVGSLRRKLNPEAQGQWIESVRGEGYRMASWLTAGSAAACAGQA